MYRLTDEQKARVEDLLSQMTLMEKIGQMNQASVSIVGGFDVSFEQLIEMVTDGRISQEEFGAYMATAEHDYHDDEIRQGLVGSLMVQEPEKCNELQRIAVEESRLGIPLIFGLDVIHGFRTIVPIALAEAGSFDTDLMTRTARMAAKESRASGVAWHFAPMLDVARDTRWGRVSEGPGEDPYLGACFAKAKVEGVQGDMSSPENYAAVCLKHYVAYSACEGGRDYNTTTMSESILRNTFLPPFKAAVEAGAATAMASFNDLNGVPCTVNKHTLREILKDEYKFPGFVVSDANAIRECVDHGIAADHYDAGAQAANGGLDMDMGTEIYKDHLAKAVENGDVSMEVIDDAVRRILSVKMWLGLFENPYTPEAIMDRYRGELPQEHIDLALEAGEKSIVLLKNEGNILPLKKDQKVALVGNLADMADEVTGAWALSWKIEDCVSIKAGMEAKNENVKYFPCCGPEQALNEDEVAAAAEYGDVIVAVIGETKAMSGEASSRSDITLPGQQKEMLEKLLATGKPVVAVLMNGRALALQWEAENVPAIVESWHLGIQMGNAVANVLYGDKNPQGRLTISFPYVTGQCPVYYNHFNTGRPGGSFKFTSRYLDCPNGSLFPFGYGLSYTNYEYEDYTVVEDGDDIVATVKVTNTGDVAGTEVVQLYMWDVAASLVRPVKELKGFKLVDLAAGESKVVELRLAKKDMGFYNNDAEYVLESGKFIIYVGANSRDCLGQEMIIDF